MRFFDLIKQKPWNSYRYTAPPWFARYPTMLSPEEMRMLAWIAAHTPEDGDIMDLGSFLGGSTACLAHGVRQSGKSRKIHAFDRFEVDEMAKYNFLYKNGHPFYAGTDSLPLFKKLTNAFAHNIDVHKGDILTTTCQDVDIAILFIDISKTKAINDFLLKNFFTKLKKGCVIVQQDFLFFKNPWLYSTMVGLEKKVDFITYAQDFSVVFGVTSDINQDDIVPCLSENTTPEDIRNAMVSMREKFPELRQKEMIDAAIAAHDARPTATKAWELPNAANLPLRFPD